MLAQDQVLRRISLPGDCIYTLVTQAHLFTHVLMKALVLDIDLIILLELFLEFFDAADYEIFLEASTNDLTDLLFLIFSSLFLFKKL